MAVKTLKTLKKVVGSRAQVFHGNAEKTLGGLVKSDLVKNSQGLIVSKKKSLKTKKGNAWMTAVKKARSELGIKTFVLMNKGPEGKKLYARAKELHKK